MAGEQSETKAIIFMCLLALQFGFQPILMKEFVDKEVVINFSLVFIQEMSKFFIALFVLQLETGVHKAFKGWTLTSSVQTAAIPAFSYAIQNLLMIHAYRHLDYITFNLLNQTKLLSTAFFIYLILGLHQSYMQCVALVLLVFGAILLGGEAEHLHQEGVENSFWDGVVPCLGASLLSGFGGAMSQRALMSRDSFLFSLELAVYAMLVLVVLLFLAPPHLEKDYRRVMQDGLLIGWGPETVIPVAVNAFGGLCIGQVTKHAGGIRKGFSIVSGILLATLLQELFYGIKVPWSTWAALPLVTGSIVLHSMYPPARRVKKKGAKKD